MAWEKYVFYFLLFDDIIVYLTIKLFILVVCRLVSGLKLQNISTRSTIPKIQHSQYADVVIAPCQSKYSGNFDRTTEEKRRNETLSLRPINHYRYILAKVEDARFTHKTNTTWPAAETTNTQNRYEIYPDGTVIVRVAHHSVGKSHQMHKNRKNNLDEPLTMVVCSCGQHNHLDSPIAQMSIGSAFNPLLRHISRYRFYFTAMMALLPKVRIPTRARFWAIMCCFAPYTAWRMFTDYDNFRTNHQLDTLPVWPNVKSDETKSDETSSDVFHTPGNTDADFKHLEQQFISNHSKYDHQNPLLHSGYIPTTASSVSSSYAASDNIPKPARPEGNDFPRDGTHPLSRLFDYLYYRQQHPNATVQQFLSDNSAEYENPGFVESFLLPSIWKLDLPPVFVQGWMSVEEWQSLRKIRILEWTRYYALRGSGNMNKFIANERVRKIKEKQAKFQSLRKPRVLDQLIAECYDPLIAYYRLTYFTAKTLLSFKTVLHNFPSILLTILEAELSADVILGGHRVCGATIWRCPFVGHENLHFQSENSLIDHCAFRHGVNLIDDPLNQWGTTPEAPDDTTLTAEDIEEFAKYDTQVEDLS